MGGMEVKAALTEALEEVGREVSRRRNREWWDGEVAEVVRNRKLLQYASSQEKFQSPSTPALSTMFALQVQLKRMIAEGNEARWARHRAMAERTWAWVAEQKAAGKGLDLLAPEGYRSPCVTAITVADGESGPAVSKGMQAKGWVIGGGYGKMKPSSFRIGHMGDHTLDELEALLADLTEVVK